MIELNGKIFDINHFPDGTLLLKPDVNTGDEIIREATITWHFENNEELVAVMFLSRHLVDVGVPFIHLVMPYIPNARQDRVKSHKDVFTLKYFAQIINHMPFFDVTVLDPHSAVSEALFESLIVENPKKYICEAIERVNEATQQGGNNHPLTLFYPDEGAMKRYSGMVSMKYAFGIKKRNWETGVIEGLDVAGETDSISGHDILIIDDICSRGGTFYHSAKKLKEMGAGKIYLYVTHCEPSIFDGEIFNSGLIEKVFTTNSIFNSAAMDKAKELGISDKIEVFEYVQD